MANKVRAGQVFIYVPVLLDVMNKPHNIQVGDEVRVIKMPGCPPPNTMGMAHVEHMDGRFAGLVCTNSLYKKKDAEAALKAWKQVFQK